MNLLELIEWTKKNQNLKTLREKVTKESDVNVCLSLLGEIRTRAGLAIDHAKKSARYEKDIEEYLSTLAKRGVTVPEPEKAVGGMTEPLIGKYDNVATVGMTSDGKKVTTAPYDPNPTSVIIGKEQPKPGFFRK